VLGEVEDDGDEGEGEEEEDDGPCKRKSETVLVGALVPVLNDLGGWGEVLNVQKMAFSAGVKM